MDYNTKGPLRIISALVGGFILLAAIFFGRYALLGAISFVFIAAVYEYTSLLREKNRLKLAILGPGIFYIGLLFMINAIFELPLGNVLVLFTFLGTWAFDTAAYYIGTKWGHHKIIPKISPNKSLEGFIGGLLAVTIIAVLLPNFLFKVGTESFLKAGWILTISFGAFLGDIIESSTKRKLEVKDSSKLIPGHGGFLDRFDSLMITATAAYLFYRWFL